MKLYTEEDISKAIMFGRTGSIKKEVYLDFLNSLTPIELPSDDEINYYANDNVESISFVNGAIWMRDMLKVVNDEE